MAVSVIPVPDAAPRASSLQRDAGTWTGTRGRRLLAVQAPAGAALLGRDAELLALERLVSTSEAHGGALVVRGEQGIGKSALLAEAGRRASQGGMRVLTARGARSEQRLAFAGLHQLLQPLLGEVQQLPSKQRDALLGAFGMTDGDASDIFLIGLATLALLCDSAARRPIVLIVDDAHWLDRPTQDAVTFVARRLAAHPIALLVATREVDGEGAETAGMRELALGPLNDAAAGALLDANASGLAPAVRSRLLREAAGNPLALVDLPTISHEISEYAFRPAQLPLTTRLEQAFASRANALDAATRTLLLAAALNDGDSVHEALAAGAILLGSRLTLEALAPAARAGLVELDSWDLRFRHPLMRPAIAQSAGLAERRAAHAALGEVLVAVPERRAWHRAAAVAGTDEQVAAELEAVAARERAGIGAGVAALERAAQLSDEPARRSGRLLWAAELAFEMGRHDVVRRLLDEAEPHGLEPAARARARWLRALLDHGESTGSARVGRLLEIVEEMRLAGASEEAMSSLLTVASLSWWAGRDDALGEALLAAAERMPMAPEDPRRLAVMTFAAPLQQAPDALERLCRVTPDTFGDAVVSLRIALAAQLLGGVREATEIFDASVARLRSEGRLAGLAEALEGQAWGGIWLGSWDQATAAAEEAARLARETSSDAIAAAAQNVQAWLAALRGDHAAVEALTDDCGRRHPGVGATPLLTIAHVARGVAALGEGQHAVAYDELRRIFDVGDVANDPTVAQWVLGDLVEAAVHCDRAADAASMVAELEAQYARTRSPLLLAGLGYARALLAEDDRAQDLFEQGLGALASWPFLRARLLLAHGVWLRRRRRVAESRSPLRRAREAFDALGATPWAERARQELRASGETTRSRMPENRDLLSPQELQIALMAAEGLSNREIGQRLFLSHRTVGSHLYRAFPKLGITNRAELGRALGDSLASAA
jgi:DNA-binding CsgD family transcriptional regulator/tetratricopeptide (TPR) repeat protein